MATVIPPGAQVPVEPPRLPVSNPAERDALRWMIANNRWNQWKYTVFTAAGLKTVGVGTNQPIDEGWVAATIGAVEGAWPLPGVYVPGAYPQQAPSNAVTVIQSPAS